MKCILCGAESQKPQVSIHLQAGALFYVWRVLVIGKREYAVCPVHFPWQEGATPLEFQRVYEEILQEIWRMQVP